MIETLTKTRVSSKVKIVVGILFFGIFAGAFAALPVRKDRVDRREPQERSIPKNNVPEKDHSQEKIGPDRPNPLDKKLSGPSLSPEDTQCFDEQRDVYACKTKDGACVEANSIDNRYYLCGENYTWHRCGPKELDYADYYYGESLGNVRCTLAGWISRGQDVQVKINHSTLVEGFYEDAQANFYEIQVIRGPRFSSGPLPNGEETAVAPIIRLSIKNNQVYTAYYNRNGSLIREVPALPLSGPVTFEEGHYNSNGRVFRGVWIHTPDEHYFGYVADDYGVPLPIQYQAQTERRDIFVNLQDRSTFSFAIGVKQGLKQDINFYTTLMVDTQKVYRPSSVVKPLILDVLVDTQYNNINDATVRSAVNSIRTYARERGNLDIQLRHIFYRRFPEQYIVQPSTLYRDIYDSLEGGVPEVLLTFGATVRSDDEFPEGPDSVLGRSGVHTWEGSCNSLSGAYASNVIHNPVLNFQQLSEHNQRSGQLEPYGYSVASVFFHELLHNFPGGPEHSYDDACIQRIERKSPRLQHYLQHVQSYYSSGVCPDAYKNLIEQGRNRCPNRAQRGNRSILRDVIFDRYGEDSVPFNLNVDLPAQRIDIDSLIH